MLFPYMDDVGPNQLESIGFLALSDAAWATRQDGPSHGGHFVLLAHHKAFKDQPTTYAILDWKSCKLPRVVRSSLSAETQAAAEAADAFEHVKVYWDLILDPHEHRLDDKLRTNLQPAMVVDAKPLYDSLKKEALVQGAACNRTAVEQLVLKHVPKETHSIVRWVSSERQLSD